MLEISARAPFRCSCATARGCRRSASAAAHAVLDADALRALHARRAAGRCRRCRCRATASRSASISPASGPDGLVGFRAKRHTGLIDVDQRDGSTSLDFWEPMSRAARQAAHPRSRRVLHPGLEGSGARAARLCRRDGAVRSAGRRIPRALCGLLRSRLRPCRRRRQGRARRARSALARSAVHPRARPDRRPAGLRDDAGEPPERSTARASARTIRRRA